MFASGETKDCRASATALAPNKAKTFLGAFFVAPFMLRVILNLALDFSPVEEKYYTLTDLSHDHDLAAALGNMVVAWAYAEHILLQVISRVTGAGKNMSAAGYYRVPTFESRTRFILALLTEWKTSVYDKDAITTTVEKLEKIAAARNQWIHGDWCTNKGETITVIFNHRVPSGSPKRRKTVKTADVVNHSKAVNVRAKELAALIDYLSIPA
jgi:hypothetical protein